nr:SDR family NAD(P)-dependent oxidoreductase [Actinomadura rayongensis]
MRGRTALVTGGATGIGAAICRALAAGGADIAIAHHDQPARANQVLADVRRAGRHALALSADLTEPDAAERLHAAAARELGTVDILVNCAGAYPRIAWNRLDAAAWDQAIAVNLTLHYRMCHAVTPTMTEHRWGRIINIGSITARTGRRGLVAYAAAKAGLHGMTRSLARELGAHGITVNTVVPGAIQVPAENLLPAHDRVPPADQVQRQCVPRRGQPEDVAAAAAFLADPAAGFITGQTLHVDGGQLLH